MRRKVNFRISAVVVMRVFTVAAVGLLVFTWCSRASAQVVRYPWTLVEFKTDQNGNPQPEVISPEGNVIVDKTGKIVDPRAGTVGDHTQTSGIQEAINYSTSGPRSDVYISGRPGLRTNNNVYFVDATIHIPPVQDFRIDGGEYVLNYDPSVGDAITIDSCEDCHFRFGLVVAGGAGGSAVVFRPTNPTPIDGITVITDSTFRFSSIATNHPTGTAEAGLLLDASDGSILWNQFFASSVVGFQENVRAIGVAGNRGVLFNKITIRHDHGASQSLVSFEGTFSRGNTCLLGLANDPGTGSSWGIVDYGTDNTFVLQSVLFPHGHDVLFEPGATGNIVIGVGPVSVTDQNSARSNRVILGIPRLGGDFDIPANSPGP